MGHSHLHAVLILYGWTAAVSIGMLLFFIVKPYWIAAVFLVLGVAACTIVTLLPLTRRQKLERAAQTQTGPITTVSPIFDELDAASDEYDDVPIPPLPKTQSKDSK